MASPELLSTIEIPAVEQRTPESFFATDNWGEKSSMGAAQFMQLWERAKENYDDLEAHNFAHATDALWYGNTLADHYEETFPGEPAIERKLLNAALLFHDAGINEPEAAANFARHAKDIGFSEKEAAAVEDIILSSAEDVNPVTTEEVIMNISDLHTLGEKRSIFRKRGEDFLEEARIQLGERFNESQFMSENACRLAKYVTKNLQLGGLEAEWIKSAKANVRQTIIDVAEKRHISLYAIAQEIGSRAMKELFGEKPAVRHPKTEDS